MRTHNSHGAAGAIAKRELMKQLGVIALITALAIWQNHFVLQVASSDIYLFVLLSGAALFGIVHSVMGTHRLMDEFLGLEAMKQVYDDALRSERDPAELEDSYANRIREKAIVYSMPTALATAHNLIIEEAQRSGHFRISTATMQILVADLETKLEDRQAMSHYLGALMVLLGLLGTFIGLMHTLESVGGILGSLDLSGSGGSGSIAKLIESLKLPLEGMSTGFGASLFGLIGSLIIGLLSKIDSRAASALKHEFETWIRNTVQLESAHTTPQAKTGVEEQAADPEVNPAHARVLLKAARITVANVASLTAQVAELSRVIEHMRHDAASQRNDLQELVRVSLRTGAAQLGVAGRMERVETALGEIRDEIRNGVATLAPAVAANARSNGQALARLQQNVLGMSEAMRVTMLGLEEASDRTASLGGNVDELAEVVRSGFDTVVKQQAAEADAQSADLIATLDGLIAALPLMPQDAESLRRLAEFAKAGGKEAAVSDTPAHADPVPEHHPKAASA